MSMGADVAVQFWSKVDRSAGCWTWTAATDHGGYGRFTARGARQDAAHRVAWRLTYGAIPEGLHVLHRCDNPPCVNPEHLFLGTHAENMADMHRKGRAVPPPRNDGWQHRKPESVLRGEAHPRVKLTDENVADVRRLHADGLSLRQIGARYGIGKSQVSRITRGLVRTGG